MAYYNSLKIFDLLNNFTKNENLENKDDLKDEQISQVGGNSKLLFSDLEFDDSSNETNENTNYSNENDMFLPKIISKVHINSTEEEIKNDLNYSDVSENENIQNMSITTLEEIYGKRFNDEFNYEDSEIEDPENEKDKDENENLENKNKDEKDKDEDLENKNKDEKDKDENLENLINNIYLNAELDDSSSSSDSENDDSENDDSFSDDENIQKAKADELSLYNMELSFDDDLEISKDENKDSLENSSGNENSNTLSGGESVDAILNKLGDNNDDDIKAYVKGCKTKGLIGGISKNKIYKFNFYPYN